MTTDLPTKNTSLNAFTDLDPTAAPGEGPLADLTIGVKANLGVCGLPHTGGLGTRRGLIADRDATVVARLRAAGAAILGTLNMHEGALGATSDNPFYGRTDNPHRPGYTPGGSSGGSGAAVAAGLCDAALGTDTLGSIRIPAAYCGVYGLKPTHGAVPPDGLLFLEPAFDTIGPLARDLATLARVFAVMAPERQPPVVLRRLVTLADLGGVVVEPAVRAGYDRARTALDLPPTTLTLPDETPAIRMAGFVAAGHWLAAFLGDWRSSPAVSPDLKFVLQVTTTLPAQPAVVARTRNALRRTIGADGVLLLPTTPQVAFPHAPGGRAPATQADFTAFASLAGLPALACPAGRDPTGLPVSIQLVGPPGGEAALIALAQSLEPVLGGAVLPS